MGERVDSEVEAADLGAVLVDVLLDDVPPKPKTGLLAVAVFFVGPVEVGGVREAASESVSVKVGRPCRAGRS